ncbi:MAG: hypothetical protein IT514_16510 [Burkholderiales bacterium]|nr:hypothetical protein [Burkholderiales bacterium]
MPEFVTEVFETEVPLNSQQSLAEVLLRLWPTEAEAALSRMQGFRLRGADARLLATFTFKAERNREQGRRVFLYVPDNPFPIQGDSIVPEVCRLYWVFVDPETLSISVSDTCGLKEAVTLSTA